LFVCGSGPWGHTRISTALAIIYPTLVNRYASTIKKKYLKKRKKKKKETEKKPAA